MALKGVPKSEEHKAKLRAANLGKKQSDETRAKRSASMMGRIITPEHAKKIGDAIRGIKRSADTCARVGAAQRGKKRGPLSPERRAALIAATKGTKWSAKTREKLTGRNSPHWGKPPRHKPRIEYSGIKFRSTWEVRFAKRLDEFGIKWEYEKHRFDLDECTYTPDFYLPEQEVFWEVKGWLDSRSQRIALLFRSKYPEIPLVIATKPTLQLMRF